MLSRFFAFYISVLIKISILLEQQITLFCILLLASMIAVSVGRTACKIDKCVSQ
jgi:hypothetical protein